MGAIVSEDEGDVEVGFGGSVWTQRSRILRRLRWVWAFEDGFSCGGAGRKIPRNVRKIIAKLLGHCGVGVGLQAWVGLADLP